MVRYIYIEILINVAKFSFKKTDVRKSSAKWRPFCSGFNVLNPGFLLKSQVKNHHMKYRKTSNISRTLVGNKIVDHSDVVGASPVGAAPSTSSVST